MYRIEHVISKSASANDKESILIRAKTLSKPWLNEITNKALKNITGTKTSIEKTPIETTHATLTILLS